MVNRGSSLTQSNCCCATDFLSPEPVSQNRRSGFASGGFSCQVGGVVHERHGLFLRAWIGVMVMVMHAYVGGRCDCGCPMCRYLHHNKTIIAILEW